MKKEKEIFDLIVIGGGAAGFFCAINAASMNPSLRIAIVEKSSKLLSKVKVSGGGRCNVTNGQEDISSFVKSYPRGQNFLKKAFHHFGPTDTLNWFEKKGVSLKTESDGRVFPASNSSQTIIECFIKQANEGRITIFMNANIEQIAKTDELWHISEKNERSWYARNLCITCGGFQKLDSYSWLSSIGCQIVTPVPSLFTFNIPNNSITSLMGISVTEATIKIVSTKLQSQGPILITHWGVSGPAVLRLSALAARVLSENNYQFGITINWLSDYTEEHLRQSWTTIRNQQGHSLLTHKNPFGLPSRLWNYLLNEANISNTEYWSELKSAQQNKLIQVLTAQFFQVSGKTTFKEEFVTCGGVALTDVDVNTMQHKRNSGLYFAGEVLDIDGITGGFNFQNAWTTGWIAAKHIANK